MNSSKLIIILVCSFLVNSCDTSKTFNYESSHLKIESINDNLWIHKSYLELSNGKKFPCNGMIYRNNNEVVIFDTPTDNKTSIELINFIEKNLNSKIIAIVPTHFHVDCLGGLEAFHDLDIPSYAYEKTIQLAKEKFTILPKIKMTEKTALSIGNEKVIMHYLGEGHTKDNIVAYLPAEKALFGGCLIKELNASKGNLKDANINQWPLTINNIKLEYPDLEIVIPGHGKQGGIELLAYTIKLFKE